ncbi:hypothetical protein LTR56_006224 [Elasticomyces elasticus]|nr:hypothetical protein LTR56_006224 [Elasticomyces elasticus]
MSPVLAGLSRRKLDFKAPSNAFSAQWENPSDVFSVLLILGGDVVARALAQLAGSRITPVAFSFGWVAYAVTAVVSAIGENKLMPLPDCACKIIGRIVRDFENWMDDGKPNGRIRQQLNGMIQKRWDFDKTAADKKIPGSSKNVKKPSQAGLCVSIYKAEPALPGYPGYDIIYWIGFGTSIFQLGIAAIPCGLFGDWSILLITAAGIVLSFATGSLSQWSDEKWACRTNAKKNVVLTRGNGSQHAIVILGDGKGLNLEDLAAGQTNVDVSASYGTRICLTVLAALWIFLLISAAGIKKNTWFLLAIGSVGILQNIFVAGWRRFPKAYGIPLSLVDVIGMPKVMGTLLAVEDEYHHIGASMRETFFPGKLRPEEEKKWQDLEKVAKDKDKTLSQPRI